MTLLYLLPNPFLTLSLPLCLILFYCPQKNEETHKTLLERYDSKQNGQYDISHVSKLPVVRVSHIIQYGFNDYDTVQQSPVLYNKVYTKKQHTLYQVGSCGVSKMQSCTIHLDNHVITEPLSASGSRINTRQIFSISALHFPHPSDSRV